jgi:hypothetical protein
VRFRKFCLMYNFGSSTKSPLNGFSFLASKPDLCVCVCRFWCVSVWVRMCAGVCGCALGGIFFSCALFLLCTWGRACCMCVCARACSCGHTSLGLSSHSTCPPLSPSPPANSVVIGTVVKTTTRHVRVCGRYPLSRMCPLCIECVLST